MRGALAQNGFSDFDAVVPVPLSPDKKERGEIHRTLLLARELGRLVGAPVREALTLTAPVSKRRLRGDLGYSAMNFERHYAINLSVEATMLAGVERVLLVDDVCTEGSTLRVCANALRRVIPEAEIVAATAGQMTVRAAVRHGDDLMESDDTTPVVAAG